MAIVGLITVLHGYRKIIQASKKRKRSNLVLQTSKDLSSDSEVIIVDDSANCIVWKDKKSFVQETYKELDMVTSPSFDTSAGPGNAVGIGDLIISRKDDHGKHHQFTLQNVYHIPDSPVNILGLSAFSEYIGDYETRGTRINSSGQDSIFTWNNERYKFTFSHSNANMPALPVNDGYYKFHKFCNFVETMTPNNLQCHHVRNQSRFRDHRLYGVGEEIIYQNSDHVEKGIIEKMTYDNDIKIPQYHVKFKDKRMAKARADTQRCPKSENDLATIPTTPKDFLEQVQYLTEEDLRFTQNPTSLTSFKQE